MRYSVDSVMSRRFAPRRGVASPPGQELLGVITSRGPSRESYNPSRKSRGTAAAIAVSAADETLSAQRVRAALSSPAGAPALLQPTVPGGGTEMVAPESPRKIPGNGGGPTKTERAKPALPRARQEPETTRASGSSRPCEGNHYGTFFSIIAATGRAATSTSRPSGEVPCSVFVRRPVGAR